MICLTVITLAVTAGFSFVLITLLRQQAAERKELYDRIMSANLTEYKASVDRRPRAPVKPGWKKAIDEWKGTDSTEASAGGKARPTI